MTYNYDQITAGYYDEIYRRRNGVQSRWHRDKFAFVAARLPKSGCIVDIGCGPGTFLGDLNDSNRKLIGFDISKDQINYANETYGTTAKEFIQVSTPPYPIDDGVVDAVTAIEVIEHLDSTSIQAVLMEAYRILRPGGYLFLTTPNYGSLWPILEWVVGKISPISYDQQHITRFTRTTLADLLSSSKFQDSQICPFMFSAPFMATISWRAADIALAFEPKFLSRNLGFLLYCELRKSIKD